jgi:endonuclease/exonuclease/phosphatase family metal-dependent hydrolase
MHFKFLTLNLWNGGRLLSAAREFLRATQADVMFIQEAYNRHGQHLAERFRTTELLQADFPDFYSVHAPAY